MSIRLQANFRRGMVASFCLFAPLLAVEQAGAVEIQRVLSPKGVEAWLVEEHSVPLIAVSFAFVGGASQDPVDKAGVANMMSGLLDEGAGDLDSEAFQRRLEDNAISLGFSASRDAFSGSLQTLTENRAEAVRLLKLALTSPRFDAEPVARLRDQIMTGIRAESRDPDSVAGDVLMRTAFPSHPYGRSADGTLESVAAITVDDLKAFHGKNIARDNLHVAVVGDIDAATLKTMLDEAFGNLPGKANLAKVPEVELAVPAKIDEAMAIPQTIIRMAGRGLKRNDQEFIPATVAMYILAGGASGTRLYDELREKRGLVYSVGLNLVPYDHAGAVAGGTSTRADQADEVVALIEEEIKRFADGGPTEKELADAKSFLIGSYPLRFDTSTKIASRLLGIQMDNLGIDYVAKRNDLIAAVTIEDVRKAAKRLFGSGAFIVVRVGLPAS